MSFLRGSWEVWHTSGHQIKRLQSKWTPCATLHVVQLLFTSFNYAPVPLYMSPSVPLVWSIGHDLWKRPATGCPRLWLKPWKMFRHVLSNFTCVGLQHTDGLVKNRAYMFLHGWPKLHCRCVYHVHIIPKLPCLFFSVFVHILPSTSNKIRKIFLKSLLSQFMSKNLC